MKKNLLFIIGALFTVPSFAQWTSDSSKNTVISADSTDLYPFSATTSDGLTYTAWYYGHNHGMKMQLQDASGNKLWDPAGLVISDLSQDTTLFVSCITTDHAGNALLAFQDRRLGFLAPVVYKIDQGGNSLWGSGIQLNDTLGNHFQGAPVIGVFNNDDILVTWNVGTDSGEKFIAYERISADGSLPWGYNKEIRKDTFLYSRANVVTLSDGSFMMDWVNELGGNEADGNVYADHFDATGNSVWAQPVLVSSQTILYYLFTNVVGDNQNGMYVAYSGDTSGSIILSRAQHLDNNGNKLWGDDGVKLIQIPSTEEIIAGMTYLSDSNELAFQFSMTDISQTAEGLNLQKVNAAGNRVFGDSGKIIFPLNYDTLNTPVGMSATDSGFILIYSVAGSQTPYDLRLRARKADFNGNSIWDKELSALNGNKGYFTVGPFLNNQLIITWQNDVYGIPPTPDTISILSQNISGQGVLGIQPVGIASLSTQQKLADIFPTITHDQINIILHQAALASKFIITDIMGRTLLQTNLSIHDNQLDLSSLPPGMYLYELIQHGQKQTGKICKE